MDERETIVSGDSVESLHRRIRDLEDEVLSLWEIVCLAARQDCHCPYDGNPCLSCRARGQVAIR